MCRCFWHPRGHLSTKLASRGACSAHCDVEGLLQTQVSELRKPLYHNWTESWGSWSRNCTILVPSIGRRLFSRSTRCLPARVVFSNHNVCLHTRIPKDQPMICITSVSHGLHVVSKLFCTSGSLLAQHRRFTESRNMQCLYKLYECFAIEVILSAKHSPLFSPLSG